MTPPGNPWFLGKNVHSPPGRRVVGEVIFVAQRVVTQTPYCGWFADYHSHPLQMLTSCSPNGNQSNQKWVFGSAPHSSSQPISPIAASNLQQLPTSQEIRIFGLQTNGCQMPCNRSLGLSDLGFIHLTLQIYEVARVKVTRLAITSVACMYLPDFSLPPLKSASLKCYT